MNPFADWGIVAKIAYGGMLVVLAGWLVWEVVDDFLKFRKFRDKMTEGNKNE